MDLDVIEKCKEKKEEKRLYFNEETKTLKSKYIKEWNLIVPQIFLTKE